LNLIGLGLSVPGNVTGNVVVVKDFAQLDAFRHLVKGKIVCFNHEWTDYDDGYDYRNDGASQAAKYGAIGALVRSITPNSIDSPHTVQRSHMLREPWNTIHAIRRFLLLQSALRMLTCSNECRIEGKRLGLICTSRVNGTRAQAII
jgi:hypothetical protein